jgi:hypothetical protein
MYTYVYTCVHAYGSAMFCCNVLHIMHILWSLCIQKATFRSQESWLSNCCTWVSHCLKSGFSENRSSRVLGLRAKWLQRQENRSIEINQQQLFQLPLKLTQPVCRCRSTNQIKSQISAWLTHQHRIEKAMNLCSLKLKDQLPGAEPLRCFQVWFWKCFWLFWAVESFHCKIL